MKDITKILAETVASQEVVVTVTAGSVDNV